MVREHFLAAGIAFPSEELAATRPHLPGILVPHLDFRVGGHLYPHGFVELLTARTPEIIIILGVAHKSAADIAVSRRGVRTILGDSPHASELYQTLKKLCPKEIFLEDEDVFDDEHSIEFPMIYLHSIARLFPRFCNIPVLPVICGGMPLELIAKNTSGSTYEKFGLALAGSICETRKKISLIVSVDGAHVGPRFGANKPVTKKQMQQIRSADIFSFAMASTGVAEFFSETFLANNNERNFDGLGAIFVGVKALEKNARFKLKKYDQWFWPPDKSLVSIAAGVFQSVEK
jgi:AmmeMemoRadiSam system protein B